MEIWMQSVFEHLTSCHNVCSDKIIHLWLKTKKVSRILCAPMSWWWFPIGKSIGTLFGLSNFLWINYSYKKWSYTNSFLISILIKTLKIKNLFKWKWTILLDNKFFLIKWNQILFYINLPRCNNFSPKNVWSLVFWERSSKLPAAK